MSTETDQGPDLGDVAELRRLREQHAAIHAERERMAHRIAEIEEANYQEEHAEAVARHREGAVANFTAAREARNRADAAAGEAFEDWRQLVQLVVDRTAAVQDLLEAQREASREYVHTWRALAQIDPAAAGPKGGALGSPFLKLHRTQAEFGLLHAAVTVDETLGVRIRQLGVFRTDD